MCLYSTCTTLGAPQGKPLFTTAQTVPGLLLHPACTRSQHMTVSAIRTADLRRMLGERRREVQDEVQQGIHDGRTNRPREVRDDFEHADVDLQGDIDLEMLQIRAENLTRIDEALLRLDANQHGFCIEC